MKYRKDFLAHLFDTTISPPMTFAKAAAKANPIDCQKGVIRSAAVPNGHDVAVFHEILFAFQAQQAFFF